MVVVQSRETLAIAIGRHLEAAGFWPVLTLDADAAVRLALVDPPAAVLVDLTLPVLDGWYVLAGLGHLAEQTVVAYGRPGDARRAAILGAAATVHDRGDVVRVLKQLLREPERV